MPSRSQKVSPFVDEELLTSVLYMTIRSSLSKYLHTKHLYNLPTYVIVRGAIRRKRINRCSVSYSLCHISNRAYLHGLPIRPSLFSTMQRTSRYRVTGLSRRWYGSHRLGQVMPTRLIKYMRYINTVNTDFQR